MNIFINSGRRIVEMRVAGLSFVLKLVDKLADPMSQEDEFIEIGKKKT